jgi:predicted negative regulator of RcsB-dependent stress response
VDRIRRKELKTDKFVLEVGNTWDFLSEHSAATKRYAAIGLAVIVIAGGIYAYMRHQSTVRADDLAKAMSSDPVINPTPQSPTSPADQEKIRLKSYGEIAAKYHGTNEGAIAGIFLGSIQSDKGNMAEAEKIFKDVMDSAPADYSSLARISLAQIYASQGKTKEAETLMRYLIDHPTALVSKDQASIELAEILAKSNPAEARKILDPLRTARTAVSRAAIDEMGRIPQ